MVLKQETQKAKVLDEGPGKTRRGHGVTDLLPEIMEKGVSLAPLGSLFLCKISLVAGYFSDF